MANQNKSCGEVVSDLTTMNKVICTISSKFDYIAFTIEKSMDLSIMKVEELQYSLEAHEQKVLEIMKEKMIDQTLLDQTSKKGDGSKWNENDKSKKGRSRQDNSKKDDQPESSSTDNIIHQDMKGNKPINKKIIECHTY